MLGSPKADADWRSVVGFMSAASHITRVSVREGTHAKELAMGRLVRSYLVGAIAVSASQLPQLSHALAADPGQPSTIVVAQASTSTAKARAKAAKTKHRRTYSARRPAAPQSEPSTSSESFGGRKFWKEQEDN